MRKGGLSNERKIWKKAAALALSAVLLTAGVPFEPVADMIGQIPITASADGVLSGSGTQESPYLITSSDDWNTFAENVNAGTNADAYYKLDESIEVTTTVGTSAKPFTGTFDGDGNTLTVNIEETSTAGTAPFREISGGAVIKNLTVTGSVAGTTHAAGLVGMVRNGSSESPNTIDNCNVSANVSVPAESGNRHMGGVVGHATTSYLKIKDTMFNGTMSNTGNYAGGLQGWCDGNHLTIENSIFTGSYTGGGSFHPIAVCDSNKSMDLTDLGAYYTTNPTCSNNAYIAAVGTKAYTFAPFGFATVVVTPADGNTYYAVTDGQADTVIDSSEEWDSFAKSVDSGITYEGKTITLGADISVTTMAAKTTRFKGTFLGKGHLLTINYTADGDNAAPFGNVENATIVCLRTAGTLTTGYKFAAGIAGQAYGTTFIKNCISSVDIVSSVNGDGTHGGLVGVAQSGTLTINNCLFNGTVTGENTTCCGGLVGWKSDKLNISNSLMAGAFTSVSFYQCGNYDFTRDIEIYMAHTDLISNPNSYGRFLVSENGWLSASRDEAAAGDIIKITPEPDEGFFCQNIVVNDGEVEVTRNAEDNTFTFIMPDDDAEVIGIFAQPHDVSVTWKNYDGTVLKTETVPLLTVPSYSGEDPTKPDDLFYSYTFDGWDKKLEKIYDDTTFTAVYRKTPLSTVDATVCDATNKSNTLPYYSEYNNDVTGSETIYPASMLTNMVGHEIWSLTYYADDGEEVDVQGMKVYLAEVSFTSLYDNWVKPPDNAVLVYEGDYQFGEDVNTIEFTRPLEYSGGNLLVIIENTSGGTPNPKKYFVAIYIGTSNASRYRYSSNNYGSYSSYLPKCTFGYLDTTLHTVTWKDTDGTVLETDENLLRGTVPEFNGTIPADYEDDFFTYSYKWDKKIVPVSSDETYTLKVVKKAKATIGVTVADGSN